MSVCSSVDHSNAALRENFCSTDRLLHIQKHSVPSLNLAGSQTSATKLQFWQTWLKLHVSHEEVLIQSTLLRLLARLLCLILTVRCMGIAYHLHPGPVGWLHQELEVGCLQQELEVGCLQQELEVGCLHQLDSKASPSWVLADMTCTRVWSSNTVYSFLEACNHFQILAKWFHAFQSFFIDLYNF